MRELFWVKNKVIRFFKNNWFFVLFVIPFVFVCFSNKKTDNDIWFLLTLGRYATNYGIPVVDPFTIHEGLSYIMQQWLSASIFWVIFDYFGKYGLLFIVYIMSFLLSFIIYKLYYGTSNNKILSILFSVIAMVLMRKFIVLRPQIFSYFILFMEVFLVEKYVNTNKKVYLCFLPILSIVLINLHASMWYFQFVFLLPFIVNSFKIENFSIQNFDLKPILITIVFMIIVSFINPYGYEALTFLFRSYGIEMINNVVGEMKPLPFNVYGKTVLVLTIIVVLSMNFFKKSKLDMRHICFFCGTIILAYTHLKCYPYFVVTTFYCLSYLYKDFSFKKLLNKVKVLKNAYENKYIKCILNSLIVGFSIMLFFTTFVTGYSSIKNFNFHPDNLEEAVAYIKENYDSDQVRLFIDFDNGGYTEYMGLKSYIDPRAEVFFKSLNKKEDIFEEYIDLSSKEDFDFDKFIDKYNFTHLIIFNYQKNIDEYMATRDDYEVVYKENFEKNKDKVFLKLYVLKELSD